MSKVEIDKSYSDLSTAYARLKLAGYDENDIAHLDPTSWEFQEAQRKAVENARVAVEEPINANEEEVSPWYKNIRSTIQSSSRVLIMSLIELVRGLFPLVVMVTLLIADGVRLYHSINLLVKDIGVASLLAVVGILAYILLVYRKAEATYNFVGSNEDYQRGSLGIVLRNLGYRLSLGGDNFTPKKISKAEWEYGKSKSDVMGFKTLMFALIVISPLLDPAIFQALLGNGGNSNQINILSGQISGAQAPLQIIISVLLNAFLTIQFLSMLDSNIGRAYALYADRDGDQARGLGYFLEQERLYRVKIEEVSSSAQTAFLKQRQQEAKFILAQTSKAMEAQKLLAEQVQNSTDLNHNGIVVTGEQDEPINRASIRNYPILSDQSQVNSVPVSQTNSLGYQVSPIFQNDPTPSNSRKPKQS